MGSPPPAVHEPAAEACYADVIVPRHLIGPFTYRIPAQLRGSLRVGHRVLVPFGSSILGGAVTALMCSLPQGLERAKLKEIRGLFRGDYSSEVPGALLDLSRRIAKEYIAPWGQCLRLVLPPLALSEAAVRPRKARLPNNARIESHLPLSGCSSTSIPVAVSAAWRDEIVESLQYHPASRALVHAPWTVRLALLRQTVPLAVGGSQRTSMVIVGEAQQAEWLANSLRHASEQTVVCYHSGLPSDERARIWQQLSQNSVGVVVGTRSAIFLPVRNLGLVWVDEEEDPALKEPQEPRYHARDVAWLRVQDEQGMLVLGSSHPLLETIEQVKHRGRVFHQSPPPDSRPGIQVVDLRQQEKGVSLSQPLMQVMRVALREQSGAILFLNRRGYGSALACRDCGLVPRCQTCGVARTYSRQSARLTCSYCRDSIAVPVTCPACGGSGLSVIGEGTERVEEKVRRLFPSARVLRVDGDTMKRPSQAAVMWQKVQKREWDVLVGTQLLFRRRAIPLVGVVGIVQADAGLSVADFRAAERTYHTLLDAIDLARPASDGGTVVIQTYHPTHHAIQAVVEDDESLFISTELSHRVALGYPPAVHLIALHVSGVRESIVQGAAITWTARLRDGVSLSIRTKGGTSNASVSDEPSRLMVLGPAPSPVPRLRGRYRWQILIKSTDREAALQAIRWSVEEMERAFRRRSVKFDVDVDPIEMR
ncbi:MAG TPA: primosomal protein N' [Nitrospiraceae bacterium]|nr:primosomal protein N' [Nitrospiraceae bacterium]